MTPVQSILVGFSSVAGALAVLGHAIVRYRVRDLRRSMGLLVVLALAVGTVGPLETYADDALRWDDRSQAEVYGQPVDERAIREMRALLERGETWRLSVPGHACPRGDFLEYWLAYRLYPAVPRCGGIAEVVLHLGEAPAGPAVVGGAGWWVTR